ncbi:MAG: hypothetical protein HFF87_12365 [Oscillibacter sp.]|nr:hypothetical protein [Oscillibacter sp.]
MQGLWSMFFQGPKESVKKLNEAVLALENSEEYRYVVEDWRYCLDELHALWEDGGRAELLIDTESSGNITGMPECFQEFVDFAPELEAVYSDHSLEDDDFRNILYSKPGDSGKDAVAFDVSYRWGGERIHISPDGWRYYHSNEEEDIDEPGISLEDVEELRKIGWGERDEPLIFTARLSHYNDKTKTFDIVERTFNSEDGYFKREDDEDDEDGLCWVENTGRGIWFITNPDMEKYEFVLKLLGLNE